MASVLTAQALETPTWDALRELAGLDDKALCLSLYLDLNPHTAAMAEIGAHANALLDEAKRQAEAKGEHQEDIDSLLAHAKAYIEEVDLRGLQALALFVQSQTTRALWLPDPVPDYARIGRGAVVAPIVPVLEHTQDALVVIVGREQGRILRARRGRVEEIESLLEPIRGQHDQGGWSQTRFRRSIENDYHNHLKHLAEDIDGETRHEPRPIVMAGAEEGKNDFEHRLGDASRRLLVGWIHVDPHAPSSAIITAAEPLLEAWQATRETELVARWREAVGRDSAGTRGWGDTLAAAFQGRVSWLFYAPETHYSAWCCPLCPWAQAVEGQCPVDGGELAQENGLDRVIHQTLHYGGKVWALRHGDYAPDEIGALLRF